MQPSSYMFADVLPEVSDSEASRFRLELLKQCPVHNVTERIRKSYYLRKINNSSQRISLQASIIHDCVV